MSRKTVNQALLVLSTLLFILQNATFAHDEGETVILSPKVGAVIDRRERDQFGLFTSIRGFESASFKHLSNGIYTIHIEYRDRGILQSQEWKISRRELVENYVNRMNRIDPLLGIEDVTWRNTRVKIQTRNGPVLSGDLKMIEGDSLVLGEIKTDLRFGNAVIYCPSTYHLNDIERISLPRNSTFMKNISWGLAPAGIAMMIGLAGGNDSSGMFRMTAGQKARCLGMLIGGPVLFIGGSLGALRGIDTDIPWDDKSLSEKHSILSTVGNGRYRSHNTIRLLPFTGLTSVPYRGNVLVFGARLRHHLTPRSGLELMYGRSSWKTSDSNYSDDRWRSSYLMANIYIATSWRRTVNPFVGWGFGRITSTIESKTYNSKYSSHGIALNFYGGIEIRFIPSFSLEGRVVNTWELGGGHHRSAQLAAVLGGNS